MTATSRILGRCSTLGVRLWSEAGRLRYKAPAGALGADLRDELTRHKAEILAWLDLANLRWGPALGDPTPGIVIDRPDRGRMQAAMAAADPDDLYAREERLAIQEEVDLTPADLEQHLKVLGLPPF